MVELFVGDVFVAVFNDWDAFGVMVELFVGDVGDASVAVVICVGAHWFVVFDERIVVIVLVVVVVLSK